MPKRVALPYVYAREALSLSVRSLELDRDDYSNRVETETRQVFLEDVKSWSTASLLVQVEAPGGLTERLLPEDERKSPPWKAVLVASCTESKWRKKYTLEPAGDNRGRWKGGLDIERDELRGTLQLCAYLVRTKERDKQAGKYAHRENVRLASTSEWRVYFDDPQTPPGGYMDVIWKNFEEEELLSDFSDSVYHLSFGKSQPVLYLNEGIGGLHPILHSNASTGTTAAIRDVIEDSISQCVWMALAINALLSVGGDDDKMPNDWKQAVGEMLEQELYPRVKNPSEAIRSKEEVDTVIQAVTASVQEKIDMKKSTQKIIKNLF
jgi:hypothetical protein